MHIHFVCSGNAYRSRLAEAYLKSKLSNKKIKVSSSGIAVNENRFGNGPICWYAMRIMKRKNLIPFMSWHENQTTEKILKNVDLLICMSQLHLKYCQALGCIDKPFEVWDIPDLGEMKEFIPSSVPSLKADINHIQLTEKTYKIITQKVDSLLTKIGRGGGN